MKNRIKKFNMPGPTESVKNDGECDILRKTEKNANEMGGTGHSNFEKKF